MTVGLSNEAASVLLRRVRAVLAGIVAILLVFIPIGTLAVGQAASWTTKAWIPTPTQLLAVGVVNGILYTVGGGPSSTAVAYDPTRNVWTAKAPMPTARRGLAAGSTIGNLYAVGGADAITGKNHDNLGGKTGWHR